MYRAISQHPTSLAFFMTLCHAVGVVLSRSRNSGSVTASPYSIPTLASAAMKSCCPKPIITARFAVAPLTSFLLGLSTHAETLRVALLCSATARLQFACACSSPGRTSCPNHGHPSIRTRSSSYRHFWGVRKLKK